MFNIQCRKNLEEKKTGVGCIQSSDQDDAKLYSSESHELKGEKKKAHGHMVKFFLAELGRATGENVWLLILSMASFTVHNNIKS